MGKVYLSMGSWVAIYTRVNSKLYVRNILLGLYKVETVSMSLLAQSLETDD